MLWTHPYIIAQLLPAGLGAHKADRAHHTDIQKRARSFVRTRQATCGVLGPDHREETTAAGAGGGLLGSVQPHQCCKGPDSASIGKGRVRSQLDSSGSILKAS